MFNKISLLFSMHKKKKNEKTTKSYIPRTSELQRKKNNKTLIREKRSQQEALNVSQNDWAHL